MTITTTDVDATADAVAETRPIDAATNALAAHPDNPRRTLGELTERSGFHLMRGFRSAVISV